MVLVVLVALLLLISFPCRFQNLGPVPWPADGGLYFVEGALLVLVMAVLLLVLVVGATAATADCCCCWRRCCWCCSC